MAKVLIVEDDAVIADGMARHLAAAGFDPVVTPRGDQGLARLRFENPDVVVLDLMMPVLSGWDVLQEREHDPELRPIPVIIVSANRDPEVALAVDKGICAFLPKPFDIGALSALVKTCLPG